MVGLGAACLHGFLALSRQNTSLRHQARDLAWSYLDLHLLACLARTAAGSAAGSFRTV